MIPPPDPPPHKSRSLGRKVGRHVDSSGRNIPRTHPGWDVAKYRLYGVYVTRWSMVSRLVDTTDGALCIHAVDTGLNRDMVC